MSTRESQGGPRVELYVRSLVTAGSHQQGTAVLDRLGSLSDRDRIAGYDVGVWGREVPATRQEARTDAGVEMLDRIQRFRDWARRNDVSLESTFERREVDAELTGNSYRSLVLPTFLLAEYRDGRLACVTPHETDTRVYTVADRLEQLARDAALEYDPLEIAGAAGSAPRDASELPGVTGSRPATESRPTSEARTESESRAESESESRVESEPEPVPSE